MLQHMNEKKIMEQLKPFEHKWVALIDEKVIASGETVAEVKDKADQAGHTDYVFYFVPSSAVSLAPRLHGGLV
jgi:hypothetical protein